MFHLRLELINAPTHIYGIASCGDASTCSPIWTSNLIAPHHTTTLVNTINAEWRFYKVICTAIQTHSYMRNFRRLCAFFIDRLKCDSYRRVIIIFVERDHIFPSLDNTYIKLSEPDISMACEHKSKVYE